MPTWCRQRGAVNSLRRNCKNCRQKLPRLQKLPIWRKKRAKAQEVCQGGRKSGTEIAAAANLAWRLLRARIYIYVVRGAPRRGPWLSNAAVRIR
jgi:hypothetical protein